MLRFLKFIVASVMILGATSAFAAQGVSWSTTPTCVAALNAPTVLQPTQDRSTLYFCPASGTTASNLLYAADDWDFCFDPDTGGTAGTARAFIRQCMSGTASANNCERIYVDNNGNGTLDTDPLDGDTGGVSLKQNRCRYDLPAGYYYIDVSAALTGGEFPVGRATVKK